MNEEFGIPDRPPHHAARLTAAQTQAARQRVEACRGGWTYWTKDKSAPVYATQREAEAASIEEWRAGL